MTLEKKLRIAFLSGGGLTHIQPYVEFFQKRGHEVFWIKHDISDKDLGITAPTYDVSCGARGEKNHTKWRYLFSGRCVRKVLREIQPDILNSHFATSGGLITYMSGFKPYVLTTHGSDIIRSVKSPVWRFLLPKILNRATMINPVSQDLADHLVSLGVPQDKIVIATLGVDTEFFSFKPRKPDGSPWRLLCTRRLGKIYSHETILKACAILKQKGIAFEMTFAAGGLIQDEIMQLAEQLQLNDNVKFMLGYQNSQLPELLHTHDFFISASLWDGTSISLLEAMATGIFPIVSRIPANTVLLEEDKTAFMFTCEDADELAKKILYAMENPTLIENAAVISRQIVKEKADRCKNMLKLEQSFYEVLE